MSDESSSVNKTHAEGFDVLCYVMEHATTEVLTMGCAAD